MKFDSVALVFLVVFPTEYLQIIFSSFPCMFHSITLSESSSFRHPDSIPPFSSLFGLKHFYFNFGHLQEEEKCFLFRFVKSPIINRIY